MGHLVEVTSFWFLTTTAILPRLLPIGLLFAGGTAKPTRGSETSDSLA